jgi:CHAD domain-containing protein
MSTTLERAREPSVMANGDRLWAEAGRSTLAELVALVRKRAGDIGGDAGVDAVHDMRTATRRLRTAIAIFGDQADQADRKAAERAVRRVARRLGEVRDLDVLLEALTEASRGGDPIDAHDLAPLRDTWTSERRAGARRLKAEIDRPRLDRALDGSTHLMATDGDDDGMGGVVHRIAHRAPALIWAAFGELLAHEADPLTADPTAIHEQRKIAKQLRYTLEAFEDALQPAAVLIEQVTALQDAGGDMHDAIVARDRARSAIETLDLRGREAAALEAFAKRQDRRADELRSKIARRLVTVRSRPFREALGRTVAGMGYVEATH